MVVIFGIRGAVSDSEIIRAKEPMFEHNIDTLGILKRRDKEPRFMDIARTSLSFLMRNSHLGLHHAFGIHRIRNSSEVFTPLTSRNKRNTSRHVTRIGR